MSVLTARRRRVGLLGALAVVVAATVPAVAQDEALVPTDPSAPEVLRLVDQTSAVIGNGVYRAIVDVGTATDDTELLVNVHDAVADRESFRASLDGDDLGAALSTIPAAPLSEYGRTANGSAEVIIDLNDGTIPIEPGQVRLRRPGVYPVVIELRTPGGRIIDRLISHIVRLPDPGTVDSLSVGVALRIGAPPGQRPDGTVGFSAASRDRLVVLLDALERHPGVPVTLEVVPETIESLTESPDPTDRDLARRLVERPDQRLILDHPYVRVDGAGMQAAGLDDVLDELEAVGRSVLTDAFGRVPRIRTWLSPDRISAAELRLQIERGVREAIVPERALLIADPNADLALGPVELLVPSSEARLDALVVDADLAAAFDVGTDPVLAAEHLLAELSLIALEAGDEPVAEGFRGVAIAPPEGWNPNPAFLGRLLTGLEVDPLLTPVRIDQLFDLDVAVESDGRPVTRQLLGRQPRSPDADLELWTLTDERLTAFESMTADAAGRTLAAELDDRLLPSWSVELVPEDRESYWALVRDEIDAELAGIVPPPERSYTLTSREDEIPLQLRNDGTLSLRVTVRLDSDKLEFPEGPEQTLVIPPGEVADQAFPVRVLTSGSFSVDVRVDAPDGTTPLTESRIRVRSTVLSSVGLILTAGALGLLAVWWIVDHRRRCRNDEADAEAAEVGARE